MNFQKIIEPLLTKVLSEKPLVNISIFWKETFVAELIPQIYL